MVRCLAVPAGLLLGCVVTLQAASASDAMPPGIGIRISVEGPIFVDPNGMTLYRLYGNHGTQMIEGCSDHHGAVTLLPTLEGSAGFPVNAPDMATRRTCAQKRLPLRAPEGARPVGNWSIHLRDDGTNQWAYGGEPLYTSIKDRSPGEINGSALHDTAAPAYPWTVALAPLGDAPAGIGTRRTAIGLVLTSTEGKTLYYSSERVHDERLWEPLQAAVLATADNLHGWSITTRPDRSRQWTYRGHPLFTYVDDLGLAGRSRTFGDVFGRTYGTPLPGWQVAMLKAAPRHPSDVTISTLVEGNFENNYGVTRKVYADAKGMTLYTMRCVENTSDRLDCDDVGDSPSYWLNYCGGEDGCAKTWRPLVASAGAKSIDDTWSVIEINPRHPWKPTTSTERLTVWAFRGRPLFTYAHDLRPGDYNAYFPDDGALTVGVYAETVRAYDTH